MKTQPKISIIMPVHKVEEYVGKAIESIQAQTLRDWEFLIVDDGTPDKSGEICELYAAKDERITVFHQENSGAPSARNLAIGKATGEYMYFMDSDDWAEKTMLEDMYTLAKRDNAQLVVAGYYIDTYYSDTEYHTDNQQVEDAVYGNAEQFRRDAHKLFDKNLLYTPWNKLFESKYILENNIRYSKTFWDDFPFNLDVVRDIERVTVTSKQYYHFIRKRAESETAAYRPAMYDKREEEHGWMCDLYKHWGLEADEQVKEFLARRYIERFIGCVENLTNPKCDLSYSSKRKLVKEMLQNKNVKNTVHIAKPRSFYMKLLLIPVKMRNVTLTLLECKVISFVKSHSTKIFAKLKAGR